MTHLVVHAATAIPFLLTGNYSGALGCLIPDLLWIPNELRFRLRRDRSSTWYSWSKSLTSAELRFYRVAHSLLFLALCAGVYYLVFSCSSWFFLGWLIHILLDLPTHWGVMQPLPFYPFNWRWPYVFSYIKSRK